MGASLPGTDELIDRQRRFFEIRSAPIWQQLSDDERNLLAEAYFPPEEPLPSFTQAGPPDPEAGVIGAAKRGVQDVAAGFGLAEPAFPGEEGIAESFVRGMTQGLVGVLPTIAALPPAAGVVALTSRLPVFSTLLRGTLAREATRNALAFASPPVIGSLLRGAGVEGGEVARNVLLGAISVATPSRIGSAALQGGTTLAAGGSPIEAVSQALFGAAFPGPRRGGREIEPPRTPETPEIAAPPTARPVRLALPRGAIVSQHGATGVSPVEPIPPEVLPLPPGAAPRALTAGTPLKALTAGREPIVPAQTFIRGALGPGEAVIRLNDGTVLDVGASPPERSAGSMDPTGRFEPGRTPPEPADTANRISRAVHRGEPEQLILPYDASTRAFVRQARAAGPEALEQAYERARLGDAELTRDVQATLFDIEGRVKEPGAPVEATAAAAEPQRTEPVVRGIEELRAAEEVSRLPREEWDDYFRERNYNEEFVRAVMEEAATPRRMVTVKDPRYTVPDEVVVSPEEAPQELLGALTRPADTPLPAAKASGRVRGLPALSTLQRAIRLVEQTKQASVPKHEKTQAIPTTSELKANLARSLATEAEGRVRELENRGAPQADIDAARAEVDAHVRRAQGVEESAIPQTQEEALRALAERVRELDPTDIEQMAVRLPKNVQANPQVAAAMKEASAQAGAEWAEFRRFIARLREGEFRPPDEGGPGCT